MGLLAFFKFTLMTILTNCFYQKSDFNTCTSDFFLPITEKEPVPTAFPRVWRALVWGGSLRTGSPAISLQRTRQGQLRAPRTGSCFWKSEGLGSSWAVSLQHKTVNPLTVDTAPCCSLADHRTCPWITRQRRKSILCPPPFHSETKCLAWIRLLPLLQKINYCKKYWVNLRNTVNFQFRLKLP